VRAVADELRSLMVRLFEHRHYGMLSEVARAAGVTTQSVREWASGSCTPTSERWPALEQHFGLRPGTLALASIGTPAVRPPTLSELADRVAVLEAEIAAMKRRKR
jgi:hypothetical protein